MVIAFTAKINNVSHGVSYCHKAVRPETSSQLLRSTNLQHLRVKYIKVTQ